MAKWQRKLDLKDVWPTRDVSLIARTISERLSKLAPLGDDGLDFVREELGDQFSELASDPDPDVEEFDCIMSELYDWADTPLEPGWNGKKVCWVATF